GRANWQDITVGCSPSTTLEATSPAANTPGTSATRMKGSTSRRPRRSRAHAKPRLDVERGQCRLDDGTRMRADGGADRRVGIDQDDAAAAGDADARQP